jgi:hypothetical protein
MTNKKYRSTEFLRVAILEDGELESAKVIHTRYVKSVEPAELPSRKLYGVFFEDFNGETAYGFATMEDIAACGIPLPDSLGYRMEMSPSLNAFINR